VLCVSGWISNFFWTVAPNEVTCRHARAAAVGTLGSGLDGRPLVALSPTVQSRRLHWVVIRVRVNALLLPLFSLLFLLTFAHLKPAGSIYGARLLFHAQSYWNVLWSFQYFRFHLSSVSRRLRLQKGAMYYGSPSPAEWCVLTRSKHQRFGVISTMCLRLSLKL